MSTPSCFQATLQWLLFAATSPRRARLEARLSATPPEFSGPDARWHLVLFHTSRRSRICVTLFVDGSATLRRDDIPITPPERLPPTLAAEIFTVVQLHFPTGLTSGDRKFARLRFQSLLAVHRRSATPLVVECDSTDAVTGRPLTAASRLAALLIQAATHPTTIGGVSHATKPEPLNRDS